MSEFKISEKKAKEFGAYMRRIRENLGYSSNTVEYKTGILRSELSRIETGQRKVRDIVLLYVGIYRRYQCAIDEAVKISAATCEICGKPGI